MFSESKKESDDGSVDLDGTDGYVSDEANRIVKEINGKSKNGGKGAKNSEDAKRAIAEKKRAEAAKEKADREEKEKRNKEEREKRRKEREEEESDTEPLSVTRRKTKKKKKDKKKDKKKEKEDERSAEEGGSSPAKRKEKKGSPKRDREEEEDEEDSEEEEAYKARTKKTKLLPNWRKITNDQRELLSNAGHDETSTNAMTHADVSRRVWLT